jgi:hypothetical protein
VSSEGQLLVGQSYDCHLHIYSAECSHVKSIKLPDNDTLFDAAWTPHGNIIYIYSKWRSGKVVTVSRSGDVIRRTDVLNSSFFSNPGNLSVSIDGGIYLISNNYTSVYQLIEDDLTLSLMFNVSDGWKCWQVNQSVNRQ